MPGSSVDVFSNSLPIITLDACHTKGKYKGMIFIATAITGDDKAMILAYGIAPTESYAYWKLFVSKLSQGLNLTQRVNLVIISDREKGLAQSVRKEIPNASHSFCVFHIEKNIKIRFKTDTDGLIWKMAKAQKPNEFQRLMQELRALKGEGVYQFLSQIDPQFWSRSSFPSPRYGHYTSNVAESINASLGDDLRKKTPFDIITELTYKLSQLYVANFEKYSSTSASIYPPKIANRIAKTKITARTLTVRSNALSPQFQIQSEQRSSFYSIFDKVSKKCSCGLTEEFGYPCQHILALILKSEVNENDFVIEARRQETLAQLNNKFILFCDIDTLNEKNVEGIYELTRRGRPRRNSNRIISQAETINRRTIKCGACGSENHNSRTCPTRRTI